MAKDKRGIDFHVRMTATEYKTVAAAATLAAVPTARWIREVALSTAQRDLVAEYDRQKDTDNVQRAKEEAQLLADYAAGKLKPEE